MNTPTRSSIRKATRLFIHASLAALTLAMAACAPQVKPWERETLAKSKMQMSPDALSTLVELHVYDYREGSTGGYGLGGGGCGCN